MKIKSVVNYEATQNSINSFKKILDSLELITSVTIEIELGV
jgi:hypothetical protein